MWDIKTNDFVTIDELNKDHSLKRIKEILSKNIEDIKESVKSKYGLFLQ